jgi:signal transduction histidine kinase/DNA-binding response OmpR family regulator
MEARIGRTILVVEDELADREMYQRYLQRDLEYDYTIINADTGSEGLDLWTQHQPDAVLLDYRLPDLDGFEFLAALQARAQNSIFPVIMVTGQGSEAIAARAIKAGAQDYLVKEKIKPESLRLAINGTIKAVQLQIQLQQRIERERTIAQISLKVCQSLNLDEILDTITQEVRQFLQTDRAIVFQVEADGNGTVMAESVGTEWMSILSAQIYDPCFNDSYIERYRQGMTTAKSDIYDDSVRSCHVELLAAYQVRAYLVVPILYKTQFWGLLIAHHCSAPRQWQPSEIDLLQQLSTQASVAIRQAELFQQAQRELAERQKNEAILCENERILRLAMSGAKAGSWDWEIPTGKIVWSPENYVLYGLDPNNGLPRYEDWQSRIHPDDLERTSADVSDTLAQRLPDFRSEFRIIHPQRGVRWLLGLGRLTFNDRGEPIRLSGINLDFTDRKEVEEELRRSEAFRRQVIESSRDCIKVLDLDAKLLYMNSGGMCLLEIDDLAPYLNTSWVSFWQGECQFAAEAAIEAAKAGEIGKFQGFCPTLKGTPKWWDVVIVPIKSPDGKIAQLLSTSRDITEQKQAQLERDRILELKKAALAESERVNRIKDEFLAVLSHELRSPLNPILGWAKLLQVRKLSEAKTKEALATIERNAKSQCQLIDDLLDMARVLRGKLTLNVVSVNLLSVVESAIETVQAAATAKSVLICAALNEIGQVSGDPIRLQQIVWNLLSNAVKFTPVGGRVDVVLDGIDNQAQIVVTDTGQGISPDFLPHIFESFRQEDASVARKHGGLGLGLAIVYQLVEAHGGTITAHSFGERKGATFTVKLPRLDTILENHQADDFARPETDLQGIRVLAIDDEPDSLELLSFMLSEYQAEVLAVTTAAEFLEALESFQPNVAISDIGMPGIDGYTLISYVRALPPERGGQVLAIALTAYAGEADRQRALAAGFQSHISKPIEPGELITTINDLLNQSAPS